MLFFHEYSGLHNWGIEARDPKVYDKLKTFGWENPDIMRECGGFYQSDSELFNPGRKEYLYLEFLKGYGKEYVFWALDMALKIAEILGEELILE